MDYSTINIDRLLRLPVSRRANSNKYHIGNSMGQGCFMDAPGYPSYFLQSIYTPNGNNPSKGECTVIRHENEFYVVATMEDDSIEKKLQWLWLPLPIDHPRVRAWIRYNYSYFARCYEPATSRSPENHRAVRNIRKFYPDYEPEIELINTPPKAYGKEGNWWETDAMQPAPDQCRPRSIGRHPINGNWCQWCGWYSID